MQLSQRKQARQRLEGMTLIEILIVVIIMAMIATAVGVAVMPQLEKARINSTRSDAQALRSAVGLYMADHPGGCPTIENLAEGYIDKGKRRTDAWDQPFRIECSGGDITVISAGPDRQMGTADDIK